MSKVQVYGLGNALVDTEIEISDEVLAELHVQKGAMTLIDQERLDQLLHGLGGVHHKRACGGSAANTLIAFSQLGGQTYYSCKVADDDMGRFYLDDLKKNGVETNLKGPREEGVTGRCIVLVTPDAERTMETFLGVTSTFSADNIEEEILKNADYVYLEGYLVTQDAGKNAMLKAKQVAQDAGVTTSLTLSDPMTVQFFKQGFEEVVGSGVDLLFCNEHEAGVFTDTKCLEDAREALKTHAKQFVVTCGAKGALIFDGKEFFMTKSESVKPVDTNGAGDMFAGVYLYGINHGRTPLEAAEMANKACGKIVTQFGPRLTKDELTGTLTSYLQ